MKIQYASDLHIEFSENWNYLKNNPLKVEGDILVLAGDIGYLGDENYSAHPFWDCVSQSYSQVIIALGNHEFYKYYDIATLKDGFCHKIRENVSCYYNAVVTVGSVDIIVSTLWAKIELEDAYYTESAISDFRRILYSGEVLTFSDFNHEHKRCLDFIERSVSESKAQKIVVVTHHVPSFQMLSPEFVGSKANGAFTVELASYIEKSRINYWIYGHSHRNIDKVIGTTQCVSNQLGYVFMAENHTFDNSKYLEL